MKKHRPWLSLDGQRKVVMFGGAFLATAGVLWALSGGMPIWFGPSANAKDIAAGKELFEHEWQPNDPLAHGDGLGPVFNAKSCASCHFQGGLGGGGAAQHNAVGFEVLPRPGDHSFVTGTIHNFSTAPEFKESMQVAKKIYPTVKGKTITETRVIPPNPHCGYPTATTYVHTTIVPDFEPLSTESVQTTALFGAGWIDLISDKAIQKNARMRAIQSTVKELTLDFNQIPVGKVRYTDSGRVGKFGWKAQFSSLDEFVAAACANELGLGTPISEQAKPLANPGITSKPDLDSTQFRQLTAFVKTLPRPEEIVPPENATLVATGKMLFSKVGCAVCHVPDMGGVNGVYSDFLMYVINDPPPPDLPPGPGNNYERQAPKELNLPGRPEHLPALSEWKTPPLWGVADSAPYWHDGSAATLSDAIRKHRGDAKAVSEEYFKLSKDDQQAVIAFLKTLKAPSTATPLSNPGITKLAKK